MCEDDWCGIIIGDPESAGFLELGDGVGALVWAV